MWKAAEMAGGMAILAERLHVPIRTLARWLAAEETPPLPYFLRAVDVILDGLEGNAVLSDWQSSDEAGRGMGTHRLSEG
jgi:hypothetical protein